MRWVFALVLLVITTVLVPSTGVAVPVGHGHLLSDAVISSSHDSELAALDGAHRHVGVACDMVAGHCSAVDLMTSGLAPHSTSSSQRNIYLPGCDLGEGVRLLSDPPPPRF